MKVKEVMVLTASTFDHFCSLPLKRLVLSGFHHSTWEWPPRLSHSLFSFRSTLVHLSMNVTGFTWPRSSSVRATASFPLLRILVLQATWGWTDEDWAACSTDSPYVTDLKVAHYHHRLWCPPVSGWPNLRVLELAPAANAHECPDHYWPRNVTSIRIDDTYTVASSGLFHLILRHCTPALKELSVPILSMPSITTDDDNGLVYPTLRRLEIFGTVPGIFLPIHYHPCYSIPRIELKSIRRYFPNLQDFQCSTQPLHSFATWRYTPATSSTTTTTTSPSPSLPDFPETGSVVDYVTILKILVRVYFPKMGTRDRDNLSQLLCDYFETEDSVYTILLERRLRLTHSTSTTWYPTRNLSEYGEEYNEKNIGDRPWWIRQRIYDTITKVVRSESPHLGYFVPNRDVITGWLLLLVRHISKTSNRSSDVALTKIADKHLFEFLYPPSSSSSPSH